MSHSARDQLGLLGHRGNQETLGSDIEVECSRHREMCSQALGSLHHQGQNAGSAPADSCQEAVDQEQRTAPRGRCQPNVSTIRSRVSKENIRKELQTVSHSGENSSELIPSDSHFPNNKKSMRSLLPNAAESTTVSTETEQSRQQVLCSRIPQQQTPPSDKQKRKHKCSHPVSGPTKRTEEHPSWSRVSLGPTCLTNWLPLATHVLV